MTRHVRIALLVVALVALSWAAVRAQGTTTGQKPPDAKATQAAVKDTEAKPAEVKPEAQQEELPADFKAFNDAGREKDAQKRVEAYEKFIADYPKSVLVSVARSQVQSSLLAALKTAQAKYLDMIKKQIESTKASASASGVSAMLHSSYNRVASELLSAGVLLDQAEEYARAGLSLMDEQKYIQERKQAAERAAEAFAKRAAAPPAAAPAAPAQPTVPSFSVSMVNGVVVAKPMTRPATQAPARPPTAPRVPTDDELRTAFRSEKASIQATLGQILLKRGKTAEGEKLLKEVYDAKPASYTMATIARVLAESAKKTGDDAGQLEYLTTLALSGRITAEQQKDFEAVYRKTHNGSLDGLDEMLDARYLREKPKFDVKPSTRAPKPTDRAVVAELFTGAG